MITQALQHCTGIGPVRLARLHRDGVRTWMDVLDGPQRVPGFCRDTLIEECRRCLTALEAGDVDYFVDRLAPQDKWRILSHFLDETTFFDIETLGLEYDAPITVIVCWHQGKLRTFVEHENLDDFLDLLDEVRLLASFNGSSFDVPRVLDAFHIPALPCAHLDLRWTCHHQGLSGGLKQIATGMGIQRPADLQDTDGEMAVRLWNDWQQRNDASAREHLIRYCAADVLLLVMIAGQLTERKHFSTDQLWSCLPTAPITVPPAMQQPASSMIAGNVFGKGSPARLRARRRLVG